MNTASSNAYLRNEHRDRHSVVQRAGDITKRLKLNERIDFDLDFRTFELCRPVRAREVLPHGRATMLSHMRLLNNCNM